MKSLVTALGIFILLCLGTLPVMASALDEANSAASKGQYKKAVTLYGQAVEEGGLSGRALAEALHQRGLALMNLGLLKQAVADFTSALKVDKTLADAYRSRSLAHEYLGKLESAYVDAEWYVHYAPNDPEGAKRLRELTRKMMQTPKKK